MNSLYLDMDGTIADLYHVDGWLDMIRDYDATPYAIASPCVNMDRLNASIDALRHNGWHVGIVSWLSMVNRNGFEHRVTKAKTDWCKKYLTEIDEIRIIPYGTPKHEAVDMRQNAILVDDERKNLKAWYDARCNRGIIDASNHESMMSAIEWLVHVSN